jgi:hypothetical protein
MFETMLLLDLGKQYNVVQVSNGLPIYVSVLDCNLLVNIENTKKGERFPRILLSREMKNLIVLWREF